MVIFWIVPLSAQESPLDDLPSVLFDSDVKFGSYGGIRARLAFVNGKANFMVGTGSSFVLNDTFSMGGVNYFTVGEIGSNLAEYRYAGIAVETLLVTDAIVRPAITLLLGGGLAREKGLTGNESGFFVMEPEINLQIKLLNFMRVVTGGGYRLALGSQLKNLSDSQLGGFSGHISFRFGRWE